MTPEKMKEIQNKIETAKTEIARAEGNQQQLLESLQSEFGVDSIESAEEKLEELMKEKEKSEKRLAVLLEDLENAIPE